MFFRSLIVLCVISLAECRRGLQVSYKNEVGLDLLGPAISDVPLDEAGDYTFMGVLYFENETDTSIICTGAFIAPDKFMVAAHCADIDGDFTDIKVYGGFGLDMRSLQPSNENDNVPYGIDAYLQPDAFRLFADLRDSSNTENGCVPKYYGHDVSIVLLDRLIDSTITTLPIYIGDEDFTTCEVVGWGATSLDPFTLPNILRRGDVTVLPDAECQAVSDLATHPAIAYDNSLFACIDQTEAIICLGDSGAPMMCSYADTKVIVAVSSFSAGGCSHDFPGFFSQLSGDWTNFLQTLPGEPITTLT